MLGSMDEKTAVVASIPMFAKLEQRSLEAVATLAKVITVPADGLDTADLEELAATRHRGEGGSEPAP